MKRLGCVGLLAVVYVFLVGIGSWPASVYVPEPEINYAATVTDQSHIATRIERFSLDGLTSLTGKLGDAQVSINFDRIGSIEFVRKDETLRAEVRLKDGKTISLAVDGGITCYGKLEYGDFKITVDNVKSINMHGEVKGQ